MKRKPKSNRKKLEMALDRAWSDYVRRGGRCAKCGSFSPSVSAHHAFGRRHQATRWDIYNGCPLCFADHIHWAHRDSAGFTEWFRAHVGEDQYQRLAECHNQVVKFTVEDLERMLSELKGLSRG